MDTGHYLVISDLQIPFEHENALEFCIKLQRHFKIPKENILCVGDEIDEHFAGMYKKSPDTHLSATEELVASIKKLKLWYRYFPTMRLCISNHGTRWLRRALDAEIPSILLRRYEDMIEAPPSWKWQKYWRIDAKYPFLMEHGDDWGGQMPHVAAALHNGISTVIGHHHTKAGIQHLVTTGHKRGIWGLVTGSLIDFESFAFEYGRNNKLKPVIGASVIVDSGQTPIFIPYREV